MILQPGLLALKAAFSDSFPLLNGLIPPLILIYSSNSNFNSLLLLQIIKLRKPEESAHVASQDNSSFADLLPTCQLKKF
jgi:hypothetical protein